MSGPARVSPWLVAVLRPIHWFLIRCYFRVSVRHQEKLPVGVPMILAPTHRSKWDSLMLTHLTGRPLYYLASRNNFNGFQGWVMSRMGCIPINVDHPGHGAMRHCRILIEAGKPLVVFPEATIYYYPPHHVHTPLKHGVAWLAIGGRRESLKTLPLVVPIRLVYSDLRLRFRSRIEIIVGDPIDPATYRKLPPRDARRALTADLSPRLGEIVNDSLLERFPATEFFARS